MTLPALASAPDVEAVLGRTLTDTEGDLLPRQLELASARARFLARQTLSLVTDDPFTLEAIGNGGVWLPERPVVAVSALSLNGVALVGSAYTWTDGFLERVGYPGWGYPSAALTGLYTHGYVAGDQVLEQVALIVATIVASRVAAGPADGDRTASETIGTYTYSREAAAIGSFPISADDAKFLKELRPPILSVDAVTDSAWYPTDRYMLGEDATWR